MSLYPLGTLVESTWHGTLGEIAVVVGYTPVGSYIIEFLNTSITGPAGGTQDMDADGFLIGRRYRYGPDLLSLAAVQVKEEWVRNGIGGMRGHARGRRRA